MKKLVLLLVIGFCLLRGDEQYKAIDFYGQTVYNMLDDYTTTNRSLGIDEVTNYLYGPAIAKILQDATNEGYASRAIIKSAYAIGIQQDPINEIVVQALRTDIKDYNYQKNLYIHTVFISTVFSSVISVISVAYYITRLVQVTREQYVPLFPSDPPMS